MGSEIFSILEYFRVAIDVGAKRPLYERFFHLKKSPLHQPGIFLFHFIVRAKKKAKTLKKNFNDKIEKLI